MDLSGCRAGLQKPETRLIKRGRIWVLFREPLWGLGAGAETYSTCPETQGQESHYPPPAPTFMNLILENNVEQGRQSRVKGGQEDNISGK